MSELLSAVLALTQCTLGLMNVIASLFYVLDGDYTKATYHLGWVILMSIFLVAHALKKESTNDNDLSN